MDAEIAKRNAKAREGKTQLKSPNGNVPSTIDTTEQARIDRIANGQATDDDRQWWATRYGMSNRS